MARVSLAKLLPDVNSFKIFLRLNLRLILCALQQLEGRFPQALPSNDRALFEASI